MSDLRVMSFNVRGAYFDDRENAWKRRATFNVETIQRSAPDLIGFQELQLAHLETYQHHLPGYEYWLGLRASSKVPPHEYVAIFWKAEKLILQEAGGFWLSKTPHIFATGWDAACVRVANWARLRMVENGRELLFLNTHLDHVGEEARLAGSQLIIQQLNAMQTYYNLPVIVNGDFNCAPGSPPYQLFREQGFVDTFAITNVNQMSYTFHDFGRLEFTGENYRGETQRIDWILLRDPSGSISTQSCAIVRNAQPPLYPSDHYPVVTTFTMR
ncbi:endonuclease/exonuclease/phosphatase family protein [Reticulibacter mediterranei]|uniref:endonuclease/exonuclease/phosphatase family protein n=1 Tax=Reticulibacter mediterranei TaxID=2778369 RepID=UPI001C68AF2F|nr:endonuclease/exonuclease/phosphatase family protein [Reticulibacter mediterranei]